MRPGQGQRRGGRRNDNRHGENRHGGGGGQHRTHQGQSGGQSQGQNRSATSLRNQIFDSNGPDMRVRGNAFQVHEKYQALAKDALTSGDRVLAENYLQHAEHYYRIIEAINEATATEQRARQASWESQPQPVQYADGQPQQGGEQSQDGNQPTGVSGQDSGYASSQDAQYQAQSNNQSNNQQGGQDQYRRRDNQRDGQRDNQRDGQRDGGREGGRNHRDNRNNRDQYGDRNQQRYGGSDNRGSDNRNPDNRGNDAGYDQQGQRPVEYQPHNQTQNPAGQSGNSQDPLYDGVDEDVNDGPDSQAAVGGRR